MADSFEFTLHSPLTKEDWAVLADYEHERTNSVTFQTPKGKKIKYIKADVLDKIRAEIELRNSAAYMGEYNVGLRDALKVIDKYTKEL